METLDPLEPIGPSPPHEEPIPLHPVPPTLMTGTTEIIELIDGLEAALVELIEVSKDGFQWDDAAALLLDPEVRQQVTEAVGGIEKVQEEVQDLGLEDQRVVAHRLVDFQYRVRSALQSL